MLRFQNGKFKIMQISDFQDAAPVKAESLRLVELALDAERPDLVVLTGDQVKGYAAGMTGARGTQRARETIRQICAPMEARGIPFTFVFGNHDATSAAPARQQYEWYKESPLCLAEDTPEPDGTANHSLPVYGADDTARLNLYMLDSHGNAGVGGYAPLEQNQLDWYRQTREALKAQAGDYVPSLLFLHIPPAQAYDLLRPARKGEKGVRGFRAFRGAKYVPDETRVYPDSRMREAVCCAGADAGLFAAAKEKGELLGMFFGHDHKNSFAGRVEGIDLGYCPGSGFASYGDGVNRGVRVFEIDEADPRAYTTRLVTYRDLTGKQKVSLATWLSDQMPTSADDAVPKVLALLGVLAAVAAGIVALVYLLR